MRRTALIALLSMAACTPLPVAKPPPPPPPPLRLVVLIVIDQLPAWGLEARRAHYRHGLDRLLTEGVVWKDALYPYANTYTAPGHAAIGTGAPPRVTGIIANAWYRPAAGKERPAEIDDDSPILDVDGKPVAGVDGASSVSLRVPGLAEALRAARPQARSVAIAGKARAACYVAGQRPDVALWYEPAARAFTTSQRYGAPPLWAMEEAARHPVRDVLYRVWAVSDPEDLADFTGGPDDGPGEGTIPTFPHRLDAEGDPAKGLKLTPYLDSLEVDAALAAIDGEKLGADDDADLLAISFSAHDFAGHQWGQESWEMLDLERRLDRELARLFDALDAKVGRDRYAVVLTSDHGATRMPDRSGGKRIPPKDVEAAAEAAAAAVLGPGDYVAMVSSAMVYPTAALDGAAQRDEAVTAMATAIGGLDGVKRVVRTDRFPEGCAGLSDDDALVCASTVAGESGLLYVWPDDGNLVSGFPAGTSHDPPTDDDRHIEIVVRAPGLPPRTVDAPVSALSVTATVAKLLGVEPPPHAAPALEY